MLNKEMSLKLDIQKNLTITSLIIDTHDINGFFIKNLRIFFDNFIKELENSKNEITFNDFISLFENDYEELFNIMKKYEIEEPNLSKKEFIDKYIHLIDNLKNNFKY